MAVRDSSIRPEGDYCGTDRVVGINSWQLSCLTNFRAAGIFQATGMGFRYFIVRHGHLISSACIYFQCEAGFLQFSLPFTASSAEVQINVKPDIS